MPSSLLGHPSLFDKEENTPIEIHSDKAFFEEKTGNATHQGHVEVVQGDRKLWSDSLTIHRSKEGKIDFIVAEGLPARFYAKPNPEKPELIGEARRIHYYPLEEKVILLDKAELFHNQQTIQGPRLIYFLKTKTLQAEATEQDKTRLILKQKPSS